MYGEARFSLATIFFGSVNGLAFGVDVDGRVEDGDATGKCLASMAWASSFLRFRVWSISIGHEWDEESR